MSTPLKQFKNILNKTSKLVIVFFLSIISPIQILGAGELDVIINEIAWMGTKSSSNDEWIELYNNSSSDIDLEGWKIISKDNSPNIILKNKIPAKGFFILERTDENTLPIVKSDLIYKGALNNKGEYLKLVDRKEQIIDEIDCSQGWFLGNNNEKKTMERKSSLINGSDPENWQTSQASGGTPKDKNSEGEKIKNKTEETLSIVEKNNNIYNSENNFQNKNSFLSFLIAIFIAVSSGTFVLFLKKKIERQC